MRWLVLLLTIVSAQEPLPEPRQDTDPHAPLGYRFFAEGLANVGDLDFDGLDDFTLADPSGSVPATIWIVSSALGTVIDTLCTDDSTRYFGRSISGIPDVDADGTRDLLVGLAPHWDESAPGGVAIYSGRTRRLLRTVEAPADVPGFGTMVAGLADLDGDGSGDILVTGVGSRTSQFGFVYSGKCGHLLFEIRAPQGIAARRIDPIGDVDADGIADLAFVGLLTKEHSPALRLYSGRDGRFLREVDTQINSYGLGLKTIALEDCDADGTPDVLSCSRGVIQTRSGRDLHELRAFETPLLLQSDYPRGVACVGDIDGDGIQDLVVGNPDDSTMGSLDALSGQSGKSLWRVEPRWSWRNADLWNAAQEVVPIADIDHDGVREFLWGPRNWEGGGPSIVLVSSGATGRLLRVHARAPQLGLLSLGPEE